MEKLILMSIIFATVVAPTVAARGSSPVRSAKRLMLFLFLFNAAYLAALVFIYAPNFVPEWSP
jgi:hypothetical protein